MLNCKIKVIMSLCSTSSTTCSFHMSLFLLVSTTLIVFDKFVHATQILYTTHEYHHHHSSLVLPLTYSSTTTTTIPTPKTTSKRPSYYVLSDHMTEPLKEVRDGYIISLNLGTPPQIIQVYLDTGSDLTWVPCGNLSFDCIDCNDYKNNKLRTTSINFSPSHSSSSLRDSCSSPFCTDIHSSDNSFDTCTIAGCSLTTLLRSTCYRPCPPFAYTYGEGVVAGTLTRDTLRVHATTNSISRDIPRFCFGCVGSTYREPIGIAGFGKGPLSLPSQLGFVHKGFSHCFLPFKYANNPNISSPLVVGDLAISSKEYMQFTPMLKSPIMYPNYYYIGLEAVTVGNVSTAPQVTLRELDSFGNGGMIIDSGTTYTHLPEPFYSQLLSILESVINYPRDTEVEERSGFDLCYRIPCKSNTTNILGGGDEIPLISFHFLNNVSLTLPQGNCFYAMGAPSNYSVAKCLLFQSMDDDDDDDDRRYGPAGVFGSFQQQNVEVVYDLDKERIGFQVADCANFPAL